jgi:hypothetical protein
VFREGAEITNVNSEKEVITKQKAASKKERACRNPGK